MSSTGKVAKRMMNLVLKKRRHYRRKYAAKKSVIPIRRLPRAVRPEVKKFDNAFWNAETIDNAAAWSFNDKMLNISKGDNVEDRTGNKIFVKYIVGRAVVTSSTDADKGLSQIRLGCIIDREPAASAGSTPNFSTIFENQTTDQLDFCAPINKSTTGRYKLVYDKFFTLYDRYTGIPATPIGVQTRYIKFKIPIRKFVQYDSTSTVVQAGCQVYMFAYSALTANTPQISMVTRTYFTDV